MGGVVCTVIFMSNITSVLRFEAVLRFVVVGVVTIHKHDQYWSQKEAI